MAESEESEMQREPTHKVTCLNCANTFGLVEAFSDEMGWYTTCPKCTGSFDVILPNDSDILRGLLGYVRATKIVYTADGCYEVYFICDPNMSNPIVHSEVDCQECPKEGCHKHTALMDAEKTLCGE